MGRHEEQGRGNRSAALWRKGGVTEAGWLNRFFFFLHKQIQNDGTCQAGTYMMKNRLDSLNVVLVQEQLVHKRRRSDC